MRNTAHTCLFETKILFSHQQGSNEVEDFIVERPKGEAGPYIQIFCFEVKYHQNSINSNGTALDAARIMKSLIPDAGETLQITNGTSCKQDAAKVTLNAERIIILT